jgi:hypothetical protein
MPTISKIKSVSIKRKVAKLLKELPDNSSIEDIQYHLYVMQKIDRGLEEARSKKGFTTSELEKKLSKWIRK